MRDGALPWRHDLVLPARFKAAIDDETVPYLLELHLAVHEGEAVCTAARFVQREGGPPITPRGVRTVPLTRYVRAATACAAWRVEEDAAGGVRLMSVSPDGEHVEDAGRSFKLTPVATGAEVAAAFEQTRPAGERGRRRLTDEFLEDVAKVYRAALEAGDAAPRRAVQEWQKGAPSQTAARWVAEARRRGFLGETRPGRAGA